jgi:hypothetical protein
VEASSPLNLISWMGMILDPFNFSSHVFFMIVCTVDLVHPPVLSNMVRSLLVFALVFVLACAAVSPSVAQGSCSVTCPDGSSASNSCPGGENCVCSCNPWGAECDGCMMAEEPAETEVRNQHKQLPRLLHLDWLAD